MSQGAHYSPEGPENADCRLLNPEMNFGDLYSKGHIEVEGDLVRALEALYLAPNRLITRLLSRWLAWIQSCGIRGARRNIHHHYGVPDSLLQTLA